MHGAGGAQSDAMNGHQPGATWRLDAWESLYANGAGAMPVLESVAGDAVPEPYRRLLVHTGDMTPMLEQFHSGGIHLEILHTQHVGDRYQRHVVLRIDGSEKPVEFGAIEINLGAFCEASRAIILEGKRPLGAILRDFQIAHLSRPKAYFWLNSEPIINASLQLSGSKKLFGRRNTLLLPDGRTLAEIVEILPP